MQKLEQNFSIKTQMTLSQMMQKHLAILQMPILELSHWLEIEIEKNPILELPIKKNEGLETKEIKKTSSLYEDLLWEVSCMFSEDEKVIAQNILGNLSEEGFYLPENPQEEKIVSSIQSFEPIGIGSENLQKSLLIQLKEKNQENSLIYKIIQYSFEDLLKQKFLNIQKKEKCSFQELQTGLNILKTCHFSFRIKETPPPLSITPDLSIELFENHYTLDIFKQGLPNIALDISYMKILKSPHDIESKKWCEKYLMQANFLKKGLEKRFHFLTLLGKKLIKTQKNFFESTGPIYPLNLEKIAKDFSVHPSTVFRAISSKYLFCPRGMFLLKVFFEKPKKTQQNTFVYSSTILEKLKKIIQLEDKKKPHSDLQISKKLFRENISLARRTITKYRERYHILPSSKRKVQYLIEKK